MQWNNDILSLDAGVTLNPELKLLQYNLGQPLELDETNGYMPEKHGSYTLCDKVIFWNNC